jgi:hypothetical protein
MELIFGKKICKKANRIDFVGAQQGVLSGVQLVAWRLSMLREVHHVNENPTFGVHQLAATSVLSVHLDFLPSGRVNKNTVRSL